MAQVISAWSQVQRLPGFPQSSVPIVTASGLTLTVRAFSIGPYSYAGSTIAAIASKTQYLCINLFSGALHTLPRMYGHGEIWLAKIVADANGVTSIEELPLELPRCRVPVALSRIQLQQAIRIGSFGSSLIENGTLNADGWHKRLFDDSYATDTYRINVDDFITATNYGLGGSNARYTLSVLGRGVETNGLKFTETATVTDGFRPHPSAYQIGGNFGGNAAAWGDSAALNNDLFLVGLLPNGGTNRLDVYEGIVRRLRQEGREVLLVTDNGFAVDDVGGLYADGDRVKEFAERYGCALADTAAYALESQWRGVSPWVDTIHMNATGHALWAESIAGVIGHDQKLQAERLTPTRQILSYRSPQPYRADVVLDPRITGTSATKQVSTVNRLSTLFGQSNQEWSVPTGGILNLSHPCCIGIDLIFNSSCTFGADVFDSGELTPTNTYSRSNSGISRPVQVEFRRLDSTGGEWLDHGAFSHGIAIEVTSGTMVLLAVVYHVPEYEDITPQAVFSGTWARELLYSTQNGIVAYTDTLNDFFRAEADCQAMAIYHHSRSASGQIRFWSDGIRDAAVTDAYTTGDFVKVRKRDFVSYGKHSVTGQYVSTNASAISPVARNRRFGIAQILAIKDRKLTA